MPWVTLLGLWIWQSQPLIVGVATLDPAGAPLLTPISITVEAIEEVAPASLDQTWAQRQPFHSDSTGVRGTTLSIAGRAHFLLGADQPWSFGCADATRWCAPIYRPAGSSSEALNLTVWPKQWVRGRLITPGHGTPRTLLIQGWATGDTRILDFVARADVAADGRFQFESPDLPMDLRLTAGLPWGPVYRWNQTSPGKSLDLGTLQLVPGASVSAYVVDATTGDAIAGATVRSLPAADVGNRRDLAQKNLLHRQTVSDARGFAQLHGLSPGLYRLRAQAAGLGEVELGPFQVNEGVELHLDEVLLQPLASLTLHVTPEVDPDGKPWNIRLEDDRPEPRFSGYEATTQGGTTTLQVPRRRYRIALQDVAHQRSVLQTAVDLTADLDLYLSPRLVAVEGRLTMGGEPVQAGILVDAGRFNQQRFDTETTGHFQGWMGWNIDGDAPEVVTLRIETDPSASRIRQQTSWRHTAEVDLRDDVLYLNVDLPNRSLRGRVVDAKDRPVEGARVSAVVPGKRKGPVTVTNAEGIFELQAIPEGHPVLVTARAEGRGTGDKELVDWGEGEGPETTLVLADLRSLVGHVQTSDGRPVAGAEVSIAAHYFDDTTTDVTGGFEVRIAASDTRGKVDVKAAGFPFWSSCMALPEATPIIVQIPPPGSGGRLNLDFGHFQAAGSGTLILLTPDGGFAGLSTLLQWATEQEGSVHRDFEGRKLSFPNLSPGLYSAVWYDGRRPAYEILCDRLLPLLADPVLVPAGGEATLRVAN